MGSYFRVSGVAFGGSGGLVSLLALSSDNRFLRSQTPPSWYIFADFSKTRFQSCISSDFFKLQGYREASGRHLEISGRDPEASGRHGSSPGRPQILITWKLGGKMLLPGAYCSRLNGCLQDTGYRSQDTGYMMMDTRCWIHDAGYKDAKLQETSRRRHLF